MQNRQVAELAIKQKFFNGLEVIDYGLFGFYSHKAKSCLRVLQVKGWNVNIHSFGEWTLAEAYTVEKLQRGPKFNFEITPQ